MNLADVHCHLDETFFKEDIDHVIQRARENNVKIIITAGTTPETNRDALRLRDRYPDIIFPTLGIYPPDALKKEVEESKIKLDLDYDIDGELEFINSNRDRIVGLGEVGMDFKDGTDPDTQEKTFRKVIELAIKLDKPLVIHSRKAEEKVIGILESYDYKKIVMHCFGGNHKLVRKIRENQWSMSIPTSIVRDQHFQKIVKETPIHLILTETDSPFLSPFKEKKNEPSHVIETIRLISQIRNYPEEDVANIIYKNTVKMFGITFRH